MAYVRTHGNQLAIVHGERDPETGKVQQRVLFSLYSKPEALAALGRGPNGGWNLQGLLELRYPGIRFQWPKILQGIEQRLELLPEDYAYQPGRVLERFREDLGTFARQLELADPQAMHTAAQLLRANRHELEYLRELIDWRLRLCDEQASEWNVDNPFFWRFRTRSGEAPPRVMEKLDGLYANGELAKVEALARFFIECFDHYADGHHYLGLVALQRDQPQRAVGHFEDTMAVGRTLFPKRLAKKHYWHDISTRPYVRGMRSLAVALLRSGQLERSLEVCHQLESQCGEDEVAASCRSRVFLASQSWEASLAQAVPLVEFWPVHSFIAAFAGFELGRARQADASFLHGLLNLPHAGHQLVGAPCPDPENLHEAQDHDEGVELVRDLEAYLAGDCQAARRHFGRLLQYERTKHLLEEKRQLTLRWDSRSDERDRDVYERMTRMATVEFAHLEAAGIAASRS